MNWREMPFVRLLLPLMLGIGCSVYLIDFAGWTGLSYGTQIGSFLGLLILSKWTPVTPFSPYFGSLLSVFLFTFGCFRGCYYHELSKPDHFINIPSGNDIYLLKINQLSQRTKNLRLETTVAMVRSKKDKIQEVSGHLLVYLPVDSTALKLQKGDYFLLKARPIVIPGPKNPEMFDASHFYHLKNIHFQAFAKTSDWTFFPKISSPTIEVFFSGYQQKAVKILRKHLTSEREFAVAAALVLGFREGISSEIQALYANTGAIHVLAVSGLHLGFIYLGVYWLFSTLFGNRSRWVWLRLILCIGLLWAFALFTGGSASVLRAASMLSFVLVGQSLGRFCNIYNSLAASAFILLCFNPFLLWGIGFQLSYLAVLGIVYFHPLIYPCIYLPNRLLDWLWKLTAVSLAAQISTFPLSLYYFHQFPVFFWLSGWMVVTFAGIILGLGLILLLSSSINFLAQIVAGMLFWTIYIVNFFLECVQKIPGSLWENIWINVLQIGLIYSVIICLAWTIKHRSITGFISGLGLCLVISLQIAWHKWEIQQQSQITIYHIPNGSVIDCIAGRIAYTIVSDSILAEATSYNYKNYRLSKGIQEVVKLQQTNSSMTEGLDCFYHDPGLQFFDCRLAILHSALPKKLPSRPLAVDYLILQGSPPIEIADLHQHYEFKVLIADASNHWRDLRTWKNDCIELNIEWVNIRETGAYIIKLKQQ